jgi:hypothetical protein
MIAKQVAHYLVGIVVFVVNPPSRNERGLSQSAENAILLAGAVTVAIGVITAITAYVSSHMPR